MKMISRWSTPGFAFAAALLAQSGAGILGTLLFSLAANCAAQRVIYATGEINPPVYFGWSIRDAASEPTPATRSPGPVTLSAGALLVVEHSWWVPDEGLYCAYWNIVSGPRTYVPVAPPASQRGQCPIQGNAELVRRALAGANLNGTLAGYVTMWDRACRGPYPEAVLSSDAAGQEAYALIADRLTRVDSEVRYGRASFGSPRISATPTTGVVLPTSPMRAAPPRILAAFTQITSPENTGGNSTTLALPCLKDAVVFIQLQQSDGVPALPEVGIICEGGECIIFRLDRGEMPMNERFSVLVVSVGTGAGLYPVEPGQSEIRLASVTDRGPILATWWIPEGDVRDAPPVAFARDVRGWKLVSQDPGRLLRPGEKLYILTDLASAFRSTSVAAPGDGRRVTLDATSSDVVFVAPEPDFQAARHSTYFGYFDGNWKLVSQTKSTARYRVLSVPQQACR